MYSTVSMCVCEGFSLGPNEQHPVLVTWAWLSDCSQNHSDLMGINPQTLTWACVYKQEPGTFKHPTWMSFGTCVFVP